MDFLKYGRQSLRDLGKFVYLSSESKYYIKVSCLLSLYACLSLLVVMKWMSLFYLCLFIYIYIYIYVERERERESKAVPLQAWTGPECSRKLRFPDYVTTAQDGGKVVSLTHRPPLPPGKYSWYSFLLEAESTPSAIVRSEGFYGNEKFHWHQLGSNQRPSD